VGESGCGKTVHALSIMCLIPSPPGKIEKREMILGGRDLLEVSEREMRHVRGAEIAMVFQDPMTSLNPVHTVGFQIVEALKLHQGMGDKAARNRAAELLAMVGIPDAMQREDLQDRMGLTVLFIAHDLSMVRHMSDRVAVMYLGKIMELTDRDKLYTNPLNPYTQALMSAVPVPDPVVEEKRQRAILEGDIPSPSNPPKGCSFSTRCPAARETCFETTRTCSRLGRTTTAPVTWSSRRAGPRSDSQDDHWVSDPSQGKTGISGLNGPSTERFAGALGHHLGRVAERTK
jgi:oligopeptide/dipeptide ABC transporter ATP-binding protein